GACCATEAVVTGHDVAVFERIRIDVPKKKGLVRRVAAPMHAQLLIEIAIVNLATPADANGVAAHQPIDRCRIERMNEQLHVFFKFAVMPQVARESAYWEIRKSVEPVKADSEMLAKFALVLGLQFFL